MSMIKITFPDGAVKEFPKGITVKEVAESISKSLAKKALAGKVNGELVDFDRPIEEDASIEIVTPDHKDALGILRHSAAHLLAHALTRLYPGIHFGVTRVGKAYDRVGVAGSAKLSGIAGDCRGTSGARNNFNARKE